MQTEVKKKSWHLPDGKQKGILIWGSVIFFTLLYLSLIFNNNVWTDEIFSMNLFKEGFEKSYRKRQRMCIRRCIISWDVCSGFCSGKPAGTEGTDADSHEPDACSGSDEGEKIFRGQNLFSVYHPAWLHSCSMVYAVQVRMYSWALFCVTACGLAAWEIYVNDRWSCWIWLTVTGRGGGLSALFCICIRYHH